MAERKSTCLCCGVFRNEIEALARQGKFDCDITLLDSMLHMKPAKLEMEMNRRLDEGGGNEYLLLYGDCHPGTHEMEARENVSKVAGINCCDILLGSVTYRKLQKAKAFIFLPEWTQRWHEIFTEWLGFNKPETARAFMKEHCKKLVYLDTGVLPVPKEALEEISLFFTMPVEVMPVSLDNLEAGIERALRKFRGEDHCE